MDNLSFFWSKRQRFLKWMNLIDSSSHVWSFLFWTCHVWYKVKSNTCYIFTFFRQYFFSWLHSNCYIHYIYFRNFLFITFTQMSSVKRNKTNHSWKVWNTNKKKHFLTLYEMSNWDASFYSVSHFLNNSPVLPLFTSLGFSIDRRNFTEPFHDNFQVGLNNYSVLKNGNYSLESN